jgi:hypothetical protein
MAVAMTYRINWKALEGQKPHPEWDNGHGMRDGKFGSDAYYGKTEGYTWNYFPHEKATEMVESLNVEYAGQIHHWMEDKLSNDIDYYTGALHWELKTWEALKDKPNVPLNHGNCFGCQRGDCLSIEQKKKNSLCLMARYREELKKLMT